MAQGSDKVISYGVFTITIFVVVLSWISVPFPALIIDILSPYQNNVEAFETGPYAIPFIFSNIVMIAIIILFYKKKLPLRIYNGVNFILEKDLSKIASVAVLASIIFFYIGFTAMEITKNEGDTWGDFVIVEKALEVWPYETSEDVYIKEQLDRHVRMVLFFLSAEILGNIKILPFVSSILLILVTYFITKEISQKRFGGIVSAVILAQSYTFLRFDTVAVYENFWSLFYLVSLYSIYKSWYVSPISYILSIFSKAVVITYFPMSLFFIFRSKITKRKKVYLFISYAAVIAATFLIWSFFETHYSQVIRINFNEFWYGFAAWSQQLRFDYLVLFGMLPLTILLFQKARQGLLEADSIQFLLMGTLLGTSILPMLTDFYFIHPYRFVPMIAFFAIGVGILFSKKDSSQQVSKLSK